MKHRQIALTRQYQRALLAYLRRKPSRRSPFVHGLGARALQVGLKTLDLAHLHEATLVTLVLPKHPPRRHPALIKRAAQFFSLAMTMGGNGNGVIIELKRNIELLSQRTVALAHANLALNLEIAQRKAVEETLKQSERRYALLLGQSDRLQEQLRHMSRQILSAQEEERKHISRELHDVIAQTLTGINIRLAALKKEALAGAGSIDRSIDRTQRLVVKAVGMVHEFARELRPAVLDDLGLIPALQAFVKPLARRAGIHARLELCAEVEELDMMRRTVLFRVAQEALTNVGRHAHASLVEVSIRMDAKQVSMRIHDDGKAFDAPRIMQASGSGRLGMLGMRERLEMIGGSFAVASSPGHGTTVDAVIPLAKTRRGRSAKKEAAT